MADQARTIRIPEHMVETVKVLEGVVRDYEHDHNGHQPSIEYLMRALDLPRKKVLEIRSYAKEPLSLDRTVGEDDDTEMYELTRDSTAPEAHEVLSASQRRADIDRALGTLSEQEQIVIRARFGLDDGQKKTFPEIAGLIGKSKERARIVQIEAIAKLRDDPKRANILRDYL